MAEATLGPSRLCQPLYSKGCVSEEPHTHLTNVIHSFASLLVSPPPRRGERTDHQIAQSRVSGESHRQEKWSWVPLAWPFPLTHGPE